MIETLNRTGRLNPAIHARSRLGTISKCFSQRENFRAGSLEARFTQSDNQLENIANTTRTHKMNQIEKHHLIANINILRNKKKYDAIGIDELEKQSTYQSATYIAL